LLKKIAERLQRSHVGGEVLQHGSQQQSPRCTDLKAFIRKGKIHVQLLEDEKHLNFATIQKILEISVDVSALDFVNITMKNRKRLKPC